MPGAVSHRSPQKVDLPAPEQIACLLHVRGVAQLERHVMQAGIAAAGKIEGMMLEPAAHEDEIFLDAIGIAKPENILVEFRSPMRIRRVKRHVAEFADDNPPHLLVRHGELPLRKQFDPPSIDIGEDQRPRDAGQMVGADLRLDAGGLELPAHLAKFGAGPISKAMPVQPDAVPFCRTSVSSPASEANKTRSACLSTMPSPMIP